MAKSYLGNIPNVHIRDYQRSKVYVAEERCLFWRKGIRNILEESDVQNVAQTVAEWAKITCPIIIYDQIPHTTAYATADSMVLPFPRASTLPFLCHELSHVINYNSNNADHHGKYFVSTYLNVVKHFISMEASIELKKSFKTNHVNFIKPA